MPLLEDFWLRGETEEALTKARKALRAAGHDSSCPSTRRYLSSPCTCWVKDHIETCKLAGVKTDSSKLRGIVPTTSTPGTETCPETLNRKNLRTELDNRNIPL